MSFPSVSSPAIEAIIEISRSSRGESGGRIEGRRAASMDLPAPGGPTISMLWPPAAAISSARLALSWPLMSFRSGMSPPPERIAGCGRDSTCVPRKWLASAIRLSGAMTGSSSPAHAASGPQAPGQISPRAERVRADRRRQHAGDRRDPSVERKFAEHHMIGDAVGGDRAHRHHQPERDRQVVVAAFLRQVGGREVDGDALRRQRQAGGVQRRVHPLAALGDRLVGQADDVEHRLSRRHQHLHVDRNRLDALKGDGGDARDHRQLPPSRKTATLR